MFVLLRINFQRHFEVLRVLSLAVVIMLLGCKPAPMTNTVVTQAKNPDGRSSAVLIERYRHAALSANVFYLIIVSTDEDLRIATSLEDREIQKRSALVATWASKVTLRYDDPMTLAVTCDACGLEAIDIMQKLDRLGVTTIHYQGFPQHTAYN